MILRVITVSLDRAMQLNTHLNSFYNNYLNLSEIEHFVIYGVTNEYFEEGYNKLKMKFPQVKFIKKYLNHKIKYKKFLLYPRNLWWFLKYPFMRDKKFNFDDIVFGLVESGPDLITFTTDDSYFWTKFVIPDTVYEKITNDIRNNFFGLWQGKNLQDCPEDIEFEDGLYTWSTNKINYSRYWKNRFSIDFNIYHRDILLKILKKIYFVNPNSLEGFVNYYATKHNYFNKGYCLEISPWVMFSLNQVQNTGHHLDVIVIDTKYLNQMFLSGYELKFDSKFPSKVIDSKPMKVYLQKGEERITLYEE